jgi:hypothetical protein
VKRASPMIVVFALLAACTGHQPAVPEPHRPVAHSAPPDAGAAITAPVASASPDAGPAPAPYLRFIAWSAGGGLDDAGAGSTVLAQLPAITACLFHAPNLTGDLQIVLEAAADGKVTSARVQGAGDNALHDCISTALRIIAFATPSPGGRPMARFTLLIGPDAAHPPEQPEAPKGKTIRHFPDGTCFWVETFPCAPHKDRGSRTPPMRPGIPQGLAECPGLEVE